MRITTTTLHAYTLPLKSGGPRGVAGITSRSGWLLRIDSADGGHGFGDCTPLPSHGSEPAAAAATALRQWCAALPGLTVADALAALEAPAACAAPAARAALECALLDLAAQAAGMPLWRYLSAAASGTAPAVNALLGDAAGVTPAQIDEALAAGFTVIKLKLGVAPPDHELAALRRLAPLLPPHARLRLDANRAWDAATAARVCDALAALPVESLEEPLAAPTPATLRALQDDLPFAVAVDESWREFAQAEFFAAPPVRRLVLKLAVHGGLQPALATAQRARAAGIECVVTTGIDSACGTLAAAHLAAAIDNGLAHGLATSGWLTTDLGVAPTIAGGRLRLPAADAAAGAAAVGLGFQPLPR